MRANILSRLDPILLRNLENNLEISINRKISIYWELNLKIGKFEVCGGTDFAVESTRGACGHSRSQSRESQARLAFFENLCIKNHSQLSDPLRFHWQACRQGVENSVRFQTLISKKFDLLILFLVGLIWAQKDLSRTTLIT